MKFLKYGLLTILPCTIAAGCITFKKKPETSITNQATPVPGTINEPVTLPPGVVMAMPMNGQSGPPVKIKSFNTLITADAKADSGLFNVYKQNDRYLLEIPDSLLGRDVLLVSRIAKSAAENRNPQAMIGYSGDLINENIIRFEKGPGDKLFMKSISFAEPEGDSTSTMYRSVLNSNVQAITAAFEIRARSDHEKGVIIDFTDYINGDNDILFFENSVKQALRIVGFHPDKSYISAVASYPDNVEIKTVKTYALAPGGQGGSSLNTATYELNSSMVLLPKVLMQTRFADPRVGYFTTGYTDFNRNPQGVERVELIRKWKLEPKAADKEKYLAGELVEPAKQIVFYIDPATPKKWVPYLIAGVNEWQKAFEKAGFKNAIIAKEAPVNDKNWSLEDARHNAIVYKPSDIPNASGPNICDPRSGEIIEAHVNWYHNIMQVLHNWYFIQASAIDPRARKMTFDEDLMGQLIKSVCTHEVGHSLGLLHNYGASSTTPVAQLRNKAWVEANGHTPSIMDYARFNYVAQPEDKITEKGILPRIGAYDLWAIEWGYRWFPDQDAEQQKASMNNWVIQRTSKDKRLWFGTERDQEDPRTQNEDLGDDAMEAGNYGIRNLKRILPHLLEWTNTPNEDHHNAAEMYKELVTQFERYMGHAVKNIGGIMTNPKMVEEKGSKITFVPKSTQRKAMAFLQAQLFTTPDWLLNKSVFNQTGQGSVSAINKVQNQILNQIIDQNTMVRLLQFEGNDPENAYSLYQMMMDLQGGVFKELKDGSSIGICRRNLQKSYVEKVLALIKPPAATGNPLPGVFMAGPSSVSDKRNTDIPSVAKLILKDLQLQIKTALSTAVSKMEKGHLRDLNDRIEEIAKS